MYAWCMELDGRLFWSLEINPGVCLVHGIIWLGSFVYGGQSGCMFGAWKYTVGSFGLRRSIRVYVWWMFGAWNFMVGSFDVWRSTHQVWRSSMLYVWCVEFCCMELAGRQFWSMEVNSGVCLVHGIRW